MTHSPQITDLLAAAGRLANAVHGLVGRGDRSGGRHASGTFEAAAVEVGEALRNYEQTAQAVNEIERQKTKRKDQLK